MKIGSPDAREADPSDVTYSTSGGTVRSETNSRTTIVSRRMIAAAVGIAATNESAASMRTSVGDRDRDLADSRLAALCPATIERQWIDADGVRCCWFRPSGTREGAPVLYLHGGGYVGGSVEASRGIAASLATALSAPVLAVSYRQGPEHPFPAAVDDTRTAYDWLSRQTTDPFIVVGDSAGGALAAAIALEAALTSKRPARGVIASSGWFDLEMRGGSWTTSRGKDLVSRELGQAFVRAYLAGTEPGLANRLVYDHLNLLPPTLVQMGGQEGPLSDAVSYVAQARASGARVRLEVYEGMPHNFIKFANPICDMAFRRMAEWSRALC